MNPLKTMTMMVPNSNSQCLDGGGRGTAVMNVNSVTAFGPSPTAKAKAKKRATVGSGVGDLGSAGGRINITPTFSLEATSGEAMEQEPIQRMETNGVEELKPDPEEPNLYLLPKTLSPIYQPMSSLTQICIVLSSAVISFKWHLRSIVRAGIAGKSIRGEFLKLSIRFLTLSLISTLVTQELFFAPSRIETPTLIKNRWLPSTLSKFSTLSTQISPELIKSKTNITLDEIGVHYLQYAPSSSSSSPQTNPMEFDAIHFNHGFGANSLSWLPAIPSLTDRLGARVSLAHDCPGFGFTDRPETFGKENSLAPYSSAGSAALGNELLLKELASSDDGTVQDASYTSDGESDNGSDKDTTKKIALFGHSMGSATTLRMALTLPRDYHKVVVLVAPALLGSPPPSSSASSNKNIITISINTIQSRVKNSSTEILNRVNEVFPIDKVMNWLRLLVVAFRTVFVDSPVAYILRRAVGYV